MSNIIATHITQYQILMDSLIFEKPGINVEEKSKQTFERAMEILSIGYEGDGRDEEFEIEIKNQIKKICDLKVGRKLIKAVEKILQSPKIQEKHIRKFIPIRLDSFDISNEWNSHYKFISIKKSSTKDLFSKYSIIKDDKTYISKEPLFIVLAHELIHALHTYSGLYNQPKSQDNFLLEDMDNYKEQKTITGYDYHLFSSISRPLNITDILCENAFLLASGLLARINHKGELTSDDGNELETSVFEQKVNTNRENINTISRDYYKWLEGVLNAKQSEHLMKNN